MIHPIKKILDEKNFNLQQASAWLGVNYHVLWQLLRGYQEQLPGRIIKALAAKGYDVSKLDDEYKKWRKSLAEK